MFAELSDKVKGLRSDLSAFMDEHIYPNERALLDAPCGARRWTPQALLKTLQEKVKARSLWNLFYHGPDGQGLSNFDYAHLCEILGRSLAAPMVLNCNAPDVGNIELLSAYGSPEQKARWLKPLLAGEIRSCFAMIEPAIASSDASNIETSIKRDGDHYVIADRKWWITGAMSSECKVAIVMGKTDPTAPKHKQQSMIIAPMDTPGINVERPLSVYGYEHPPLGHAEIAFDHVRVPAENILLGERRGFEIAQGRLGPGRIHHCMRFIGLAGRALEGLCARGKKRVAFGSAFADMGAIRQTIGQSRCDIEQARLVTLKAAWAIDKVGAKAARTAIAEVVPFLAGAVIDRAIQVHGGGGLSQDFFLAEAFAETRFLRIGDGPDEVHREALARLELAKSA
jgi:acyl-CoA dehydrogenase